MSSPTSPHYPTSLPSRSSSTVFSAAACSTSSASRSSSSASASTSASPSLPSWHFPFGPSSRYHLSERPARTHTRIKTSYTPRAPVLSTELRAHRRAQNSSLGSHPSPPASEYSRSPLSRFSSYGSSIGGGKAPAIMARSNGAPLTPAKTPRRTSSLQNSPFSDYFSNDARSSLSTNVPAPSTETKALLVKMNKLQSKLMRDQSESGREAINIVGRKLAEIDLELETLHSRTRLPSELDDSSVFMPEEKSVVRTPQHSREPSCQSCDSLDSSIASSRIFDEDGATLKQYQAERTWYLRHMQELLEKLNAVQAELRQRHTDFTELHDRHYTILEEKEAEIEQLRSENEGLRQDLGFEYSELLFLKLQMKSLEVDIDDLRDDNSSQLSGTKRNKNEILSEMDRWRTDSDWQDVEARFKRRRSKYGIPTSPVRKASTAVHSTTAGEDDWKLETVRESRGRVTSLTIKRTNSSQSIFRSPDADVATKETIQPVTLIGTTDCSSINEIDGSLKIKKRDAEPPIRSYADRCTQTYLTLPDPLDEEAGLLPLEDYQEDQDDQEGEDHQEGVVDEYEEEKEEDDVEEEEEEDDVEEEEEEDDDNSIELQDCAITTSASSEADVDLYQDVEEDEETILEQPTLLSVPHKSAWQELWSSLQSLTGIPDDDEDEDEY